MTAHKSPAITLTMKLFLLATNQMQLQYNPGIFKLKQFKLTTFSLIVKGTGCMI